MVFLLFKEMGVKETTAIKLGALEHKEVHLSDIRKRNKLLEDKVSQLEYELLKGKLPKQFMLNLLTTVSSFSILENASRTENITAEMASVLRYYLDNSSEVISLSEELKQIECYQGSSCCRLYADYGKYRKDEKERGRSVDCAEADNGYFIMAR